MILPLHCALCRRPGTSLCVGCSGRLDPAAEVSAPPGLDRCVSLFAYEGAGKVVIARLKFHNHRDALGGWARALAAAVAIPVGPGPRTLVTWVPTTSARRRQRGYDQSELLARRVAAVLGVGSVATVRRHGADVAIAQTERRRAERFDLRFEPVPRAVRAVGGAVVVLVDDVRTTGASLAAAGATLRRMGAASVVGATLAATPGGHLGSQQIHRHFAPEPVIDPLPSERPSALPPGRRS